MNPTSSGSLLRVETAARGGPHTASHATHVQIRSLSRLWTVIHLWVTWEEGKKNLIPNAAGESSAPANVARLPACLLSNFFFYGRARFKINKQQALGSRCACLCCCLLVRFRNTPILFPGCQYWEVCVCVCVSVSFFLFSPPSSSRFGSEAEPFAHFAMAPRRTDDGLLCFFHDTWWRDGTANVPERRTQRRFAACEIFCQSVFCIFRFRGENWVLTTGRSAKLLFAVS